MTYNTITCVLISVLRVSTDLLLTRSPVFIMADATQSQDAKMMITITHSKGAAGEWRGSYYGEGD